MISDRSRRHLPPYVSYRTFRNFVDGLQNQQIPDRIDRSYWGRLFSGSTGTQLMSALHFLGLTDANDAPTNRLRLLVSANDEKRTVLFKEITQEAFSFVLQGQINPQAATYAQFEEIFHNRFELSGDVSRKCIKFFVAIANDANLPLSPFIMKRFRPINSGSASKTVSKKISTRANRNASALQYLEKAPLQMSWNEMLLTKFPTFDPNWSDEVKLEWFGAFDELLKRGSPNNYK